MAFSVATNYFRHNFICSDQSRSRDDNSQYRNFICMNLTWWICCSAEKGAELYKRGRLLISGLYLVTGFFLYSVFGSYIILIPPSNFTQDNYGTRKTFESVDPCDAFLWINAFVWHLYEERKLNKHEEGGNSIIYLNENWPNF